MPSSPSAMSRGLPEAMHAVRALRLRQIMGVLGLAMACALAYRLALGRVGLAVPLLSLVLGLIGVSWLLLGRGRMDAAAGLLLYSVFGMITALVVVNNGLRDQGLLAYPAILVCAAALGGPRLMASLIGMMLLTVLTLGVGLAMGWYQPHLRQIQPSGVADISLMLGTTGAALALLMGDLRRAFAHLQSSNQSLRASQLKVEELSTRDPLTGLPNRAAMRDRYEVLSAQARRGKRRVAVLHLDLDHFRAVNDTLGPGSGDDLLRRMGVALTDALRADDAVGRLGGDEFVVLLADIGPSDAAAQIASKLLTQIARPLVLSGEELTPAASMGVALFPDDGQDFDTLLASAEAAMYRAKQAGGNALRFFDAGMNESLGEHLRRLARLRRALPQGELVLYYQPQVELATGRIVGAEALVRWQHPEDGLVPPADFIPLAEQSGLIVEIGAWVLQEACRQAALWRQAGLHLTMAVNLSPVQVRRGTLEQDVQDALGQSGLPPECLELELTESLLIEDTEGHSAMLSRLHAQGITFAIDDFGTGYSNLAYLKRFEVDRLKIDRSFVRRLTENADDAAIVRAIVQMAQALRLDVLAEGIEDAATRARLQELGCRLGQGYLWSPPMPAAAFEAYVGAYAAHEEQGLVLGAAV